MRVTFTSTLFWLVHLSILYFANGAESEEVYKPRRWTAAAGDGPYRLVVSSEWETLDGEESVSLAVAQEKKKKEGQQYDKVTQRAMGKRGGRKPEQRKRWRAATSTGPPQTMSYNLYNHFRPLEQDLPSESLIPFLDFGRKLSTNSIESSSTPRGEEVKIRTRLLPVNRTEADRQNKTETTNVHYDLQSNESGINLHTVLSPDYGLKLNKTSDENSTQNSIISDENKTVKNDNATSSSMTEKSVTEMAEIKLDKPKNSSTSLTQNKTNDTPSVETVVPVPAPKPTARILSTAVVTSVSVKESPWPSRIKTNLTRPETYQRLAWRNFSADNAPLHYSPETRARGDNYTFIMQQQNLRRKMYTTYRPKTTTYRPVTFRNVFRRNFTGLGAGVVHILSTPPTYIEVPKILANAPAKIVSSEALLSTLGTPEPVLLNTTVKPDPLPSIPTTDQQASTIATRSTKVYSTTLPPATTQTTTTTTTKPTTPSTTPSATTLPTTSSTTTTTEAYTTVSTTLPTTTSSTTVSTTSTTTTPEPTTLSTTTRQSTTSTTTASPSIQTSITYSLSSSVTQQTETFPEITEPSAKTPVSENASVEIEFKPLDLANATRRPNLLWLYNQRNHSLGTPPVAYPESHIGLVSYVLAGLALIPLILGLSVLARQIFKKSKKKVLDESEYSSEYNRTPLPTKLPRVPAHINWEGEKQPTPATSPPVPVTKWEFSRDKLRLQTVLGQGNFGQVWKAEADDLSGHEGSTRLVAVKTVKEGSSPREKEDLLRELGIMQELGAHPNVVTLLGCCTEKEPYLLIMEYVMYGKLLAFLREHRTRAHYFNFSDLSSALTSRDLTFFSYCVARGMEYLVTKGIIHRDLAARNILVDHTKLCKIADFGMSRNVRDTGQIYEQRPNRGALPIRWMAPESLHMSLFTHKSDVWSFGILLWEIITLGSTPYSKMGAREVMREVREGYRLDKPKHCRPELYRVAAKCWQSDPGKRPSFSELKQDLANLLADEQTNGEYVDLEALTEEMADQPT